MGSEDMRRQRPNVERMNLLGATVVPVEIGTRTLKEATSEAIRDWITNVETTHYIIGSCVGPAPYPELVRDLQCVIGREAREQMLEVEGRLPDVGRSPASAAARTRSACSSRSSRTRASRSSASRRPTRPRSVGGRKAVLHGARSSVLADDDGQIMDAHSISAGLDYPGVGPEHAFLRDIGRVRYLPCTDDEALRAFQRLTQLEGIIPALESSHALAKVDEVEGDVIALCLSGRGDKDLDEALRALRESGVDRVSARSSSSTSWPGPRRPTSPRPRSRAAPT